MVSTTFGLGNLKRHFATIKIVKQFDRFICQKLTLFRLIPDVCI